MSLYNALCLYSNSYQLGHKSVCGDLLLLLPYVLMSQLRFLKQDGEATYWHFNNKKNAVSLDEPIQCGRKKIHTLIISDTHFGTSACRANALLALLETFDIEQNLILLGDIFHDLNFTRIPGKQWEVISQLRKLTDPDLSLEQIWIRGNHDHEAIHVFRHLVGLEVREEFRFEHAGKKYLTLHGDQFDRFVIDFPGITKIIIKIHEYIMKVDPQHRHIGGWFMRKSGEWTRESEKVAERALRYGKEENVDFIICGHTHKAMRQKEADLEYLNTGCWVKNPCSFIIITDDGPELHYIQLIES